MPRVEVGDLNDILVATMDGRMPRETVVGAEQLLSPSVDASRAQA
ncbi:hypothetical protein [Agromyces bauzanensis]